MSPQTSITHENQEYLDRPVYVLVSKAHELSVDIAKLFGRVVIPRIEDLLHYERNQLRWMVPDGLGGLTPKQF